jgi:CPA2 family monovalent cation:H+ antiporter-2
MSFPLLNSLAVIMVTAGVVTVIFHRLRQPVLLGYIIAGVMVGPYAFETPIISDEESIRTLADLGVIFLLFSLGLEFNLRRLARVGISAGLAAAMEISLMVWLGYNTGRLFGWDAMDSVFLGAMMSISSSMVIVKVLSGMNRHREPFADMMFGILVFEDIFAVAMLGLLSSLAMTHSVDFVAVAETLGRLGMFLVIMLVVGLLLIPPLLRYVGRFKNNEMLLITVLGVCFTASLLATETGFSVALGAFIAGAVVAEAPDRRRIISLVEPVRDLFSAIFFVTVGMMIDPAQLFGHAVPILVISAGVIFGKTLTCTLGALLTGSSPRSAIHVGAGMAQIGEFSYIIAALGLSLGVINAALFPIAVSVSVVTIFVMPLLLRGADRFATLLERKTPPPLVATMMAYGQWVSMLRKASPVADQVRIVLRRSLLQILLNLIIGSGLFIGAAALARQFSARSGGWWTALPEWTGGIGTICWFGALLVSLLLLIAVFRKIQAVGMILSEMAIPHDMARNAAVPYRAIVANTVLILGTLVVCAWLLMVSALILPPWPMLLFLGGVAILVAVGLRASFIRLYARGQVMLRDMFSRPLESTDPGTAPTLPPLLHKAGLSMVAVPEGSPVRGRRIGELDLRARTGASVIGIERDGSHIVNPGPEEALCSGDGVMLIGNPEQLRAARELLEKGGGD